MPEKKSAEHTNSHNRLGGWAKVTGIVAVTSLALVACGGDGGNANGENGYPSKAIDFIIPYNPGGGADPAGREFSSMLADELDGGRMNVLNVPGGDESIGITQLATSAADGHTIGMATSGGLLGQPLINSDAQYEGLEDFTPLVRMTDTPYGLFVAGDSEFDTLDDLINAAKENPGGVRISAPTRTGNTALVVYWLEQEADIDVTLVATTGGSGEAALEVMSGRIEAMVGNAQGQLGLVESGDMKALAYTGEADYSDKLPDATSFKDAGYDIPFTSDYMTFAPANLPEDVEARLTEAAKAVAESDEWSEWARNQGGIPDTLTGDELVSYLEDTQKNIERGLELADER